MMAKVEVDFRDVFSQTIDGLDGDGLLLVSQGADGKPNVMTIGWATVGTIWRRQIFLALVRPSRHTHQLLEQSGDFTVNVMPVELGDAVAVCGDVSGREHDKFAEQGLTAVPAAKVKAPVIEQALVQYECRTVQKTEMNPANTDPAIISRFYGQGNFHTLYFGEIVAVRAEEGFVK
jgi:flavin reductase (DIM6/NTAB) family NADH-FMN oxidoreductase RutF